MIATKDFSDIPGTIHFRMSMSVFELIPDVSGGIIHGPEQATVCTAVYAGANVPIELEVMAVISPLGGSRNEI